MLFRDAFDNKKYVVTPIKLCRTGFAMFEDGVYEDMHDFAPVKEENSGSSDEADKMDKVAEAWTSLGCGM